MLKRNPYRSVQISDVDIMKLSETVKEKSIVFSIDVAKSDMCAVFMDRSKEVLLTIKWEHPRETRDVLNLLDSLPYSHIEAAMEPSGTYGDALRYQLNTMGIQVFSVSTHRSHLHNEVYDGVPSSHDAKSAAVIGDLHIDGRSSLYEEESAEVKDIRAAINILEMYRDMESRLVNNLESLLSRYWPELPTLLSKTSSSLLHLLESFGGPEGVASNEHKASELLCRVSRHQLSSATIANIIESAHSTLGVPMKGNEARQVQEVCKMLIEIRKKIKTSQKRVEQFSNENANIGHMSNAVGKVTSAVIYSFVGPPEKYSNSGSFVKAMGLNLKERSSGKHKGQLKITKRGHSIVRRYLYLAVLRLIQEDICFHRWYMRKVRRDGGRKKRAIVALMRKLAKALWHVGRGMPFEPILLFDYHRLKLSESQVLSDDFFQPCFC
ncbi:MAG: IS110 family transposase [Methanobacteriota archaeon]|nr:MAG: IS110 family transposase [Euryarchaeota archaeon]